jgi:hypothetical protein
MTINITQKEQRERRRLLDFLRVMYGLGWAFNNPDKFVEKVREVGGAYGRVKVILDATNQGPFQEGNPGEHPPSDS